jgi:hypothetical protein
LDVRTALEVQKEQETTDQIMNKLFENPKFRNAVEQALRVLKWSHIANNACMSKKSRPWVEKVNQIREQTKILRIYFNNHYGGKAVVNALQFKEMIGVSLSADEKRVMENAKAHNLGN